MALIVALVIPTPAAAEGDTSAPSNLAAAVTICNVRLTWDAPSEDTASVTGYRMLRASGSDALSTLVADTEATDTAYTDSTITSPGRYSYHVQALRSGSASGGTNTVEVAVPRQPAATSVTVDAVPIVVDSTTADYFVLYVRHDQDGTVMEIPVAVVQGESGTTELAENIAALPAEDYRVEKYLVADPADVDRDCIDDITELQSPLVHNPINPAHALDIADGAVSLPNLDVFDMLLSSGTELKFVIYGLNTERPSVYFANVGKFPRHDDFQLEYGLGKAVRGNAFIDRSPSAALSNTAPFFYYTIQLSHEWTPNDTARIHTLLAANMPLLDDNLGLWLRDSLLLDFQSVLPSLRESRVQLLFSEDLFGKADFQSLNRAVGYGLLRTMETGERPHPRDIVLYEALPNDLPRVAGIITAVPQTKLSHVNLRAVQQGVPNAFIRNPLDLPSIANLIGSYVRYEVSRAGWSLRKATTSEVEAHYASSRPAMAQTPQRDLSVTTITPLSQIAFSDWDAFGVKAANLAVLRTLGFPQGTVPNGYAIPFYFYDEFMKHNGFYERIKTMLANEDFKTDFGTQASELKSLRKAIEDANTPEWIIEAIQKMNEGFDDGINRRYRSSTNNEDLPNFNGAGLYDSKSQKPSEDEDDLAKSLKEVYASLWNFRAFSEREFHRVDHLQTAMGILVHPSYQDELANGVAVSYDPVLNSRDLFYANTQVGEDLVTNPEAHSLPEEILLSPNQGEVIVLNTSNLVEPGTLLLAEAQMSQLGRHLASIHDQFTSLYNPPANERFAMEIEFKITSHNVLAIKQARPWVFADATPASSSPAIVNSPGQSQSQNPPPSTAGGGGGVVGGGPPPGAQASAADFEWTVEHDIEALDEDNAAATGAWSNGATLWILDNAQGSGDATYAYDLDSGERLEDREFELAERNRAPRGVWSDKKTVWVSDSGRERLFAYDLESGARLEEREIELARRNRDARGIWSDGETMWVLDGGKDSVFAYDLERGESIAEYALAEVNGDPHGIWSDGHTVWVSNHDPKRLFAYRLPAPEAPEGGDPERLTGEDFRELSTAGNNSPRGIWSDGDVMYVVDANDAKVYSYNMPDAIDARLSSLTLEGIDIGEFDPQRTAYEGHIGEGVTETAVTAEAMQRRTNVAVDPSDADGDDTNGHQVALAGVSEITVTVTSADGTRKKGYRVSLRRAGDEPWSHCLRGGIAVGFSLVVYEGGTVEDLATCAQSRDVLALYALHEGAYVTHILGAPAFVNQRFGELYADGVPALTTLVAGSDGPASDDPVGEIGAPGSWPRCLRGDIVEGFSLMLYAGGSIEELAACAERLNVTALYALAGGEWVSHIIGAPDFVNRSFRGLFREGLPAATPLVAKGDGLPDAGSEDDTEAGN